MNVLPREMTSTSGNGKSRLKQPKFVDLYDLASEEIGGKILCATDEWFATADNLLKPSAPEWREGVFTECGKWMDGWETRRKRKQGYDWCIIQLGKPGTIYGIDVDTSYFTGNYAPRCSIQAACLNKKHIGKTGKRKMGTAASDQELKSVEHLTSEDWEFIVPLSPLQPGYKTTCHHYFTCKTRKRFTHLRLNIYPDGGLARLRVYGQVTPVWSNISTEQTIDLVAMDMGGVCIGYSDAHFGHPRNLIKPEQAQRAEDGWLTARKATRPAIIQTDNKGKYCVPGSEWCVFKLGHPGIITQIEIDTNHFQGSFPDSCRIEGCCVTDKEDNDLDPHSLGSWKTLLPPTKLAANTRFFMDSKKLNNIGVISHVRLVIAPDGGLSRMRLWGNIANQQVAKL